MNIVLWITQVTLAAIFLSVGSAKLLQSKAKLEPRMGWVGDFDAGHVKSIGVLEMLAGIGLILPAALEFTPVLTAWAATGLSVLMLGAALTHARRKETLMIVPTFMLALVAGFAAWGRFGPYSF